jgi:hypothetical protein
MTSGYYRKTYEFKDDKLARAISATFERRNTAIPAERPDALSQLFAEDPTKVQQWAAFVDNVDVKPGSLAMVVADLAGFLMPHVEKARDVGGQ